MGTLTEDLTQNTDLRRIAEEIQKEVNEVVKMATVKHTYEDALAVGIYCKLAQLQLRIEQLESKVEQIMPTIS